MTFQEIYQDVKSQANTFIEDIAKLTHRSKAAVRKWIAGECAPDMNVQEKLSQYFNRPIEELFPPKECTQRTNERREEKDGD